MFSPFDDYLVHLKLAEAREIWAGQERLRSQLGDGAFEQKGSRGWKATVKFVLDELMRGGFGRAESAADIALERTAWEARGE